MTPMTTSNNKPASKPDPVKDYLETIGVVCHIQHIGPSCPPFCEDKSKPFMGFPRRNHIHGDEYRLTLTRTQNTSKCESFQYWDSMHNAERNWLISINARMGESNRQDALLAKHGANRTRANSWTMPALKGKATPNVTDISACIERTRPEDYESWCGDFGYEPDSRKAHAIWEACNAQYRQMSHIFTPAELARLDELLREY